MIPENPYDSYELVLATDPSAPHYIQKRRLFSLNGLGDTVVVPLTRLDPLPDRVLQYLRIQRATSFEIAIAESSGANTMVTARNEFEVLGAYIGVVKELLARYAFKLDQKACLDEVYAPGSNAWSAVYVSLGEQEILTASLAAAEGRLAVV